MNSMTPKILIVVFVLVIAVAGGFILFQDDSPQPTTHKSEGKSESRSIKERASERNKGRARKSDSAGSTKEIDPTQEGDIAKKNGGSSNENGEAKVPGTVNPDGTIVGDDTPKEITNKKDPHKGVPSKYRSAAERRAERLAAVSKMKLAEAEEGATFVREADFGFKEELDDNSQVAVRQRMTVKTRKSGVTQRGMEKAWTGISKQVSGIVFEVKNGIRYPLADVLVTDFAERHRTYTNAEGRFTFEAVFTDHQKKNPRDSRDNDPSNDRIYLIARSDGYRMMSQLDRPTRKPGVMNFSGEHFMPEEYETEDGALLEMVWHGSDTVKAKIKNPPSEMSGLTIFAESYSGTHSARGDDSLYLSAVPDSEGMVEFTFPPRKKLEIGVIGAGFTAKRNPNYNFEEGYYELELESVTNSWVSGKIVDARSGEGVVGARIFGYTGARSAVYSDASGSFGAWIANNKNGENLQMAITVSHPDYAEAYTDLGTTYLGAFNLEGGVSPGGPWVVKLRPLVNLKATVTTTSGEGIEENISCQYREGQKTFRFPMRMNAGVIEIMEGYVPWGMETLTYYASATDNSGNYRKMKFTITIEEHFWSSSDSYIGNFFAQN